MLPAVEDPGHFPGDAELEVLDLHGQALDRIEGRNPQMWGALSLRRGGARYREPVLDDAAKARVMFLAGAALQGAVDQDAPAAAAAINAISAEHGGEGLTEAIIAWCDTLTAALPLPSGGDLVGLGWVDESGRARTADDVDPQVRWAGQIVMAQAREDKDTFSALIAALPDDGMAVSQHLAVLLRLIATNLRPATSSRPTNPDEDGDG